MQTPSTILKIFFVSLSLFTLPPFIPVSAEELRGAQNPLTMEMMKLALSQERSKAFVNVMKDLPTEQQQKFWDIYKDYEAEKRVFDDRRLKLLDQYMTNYLLLTPSQAASLMEDWIRLQQDQLASRIKMFKKLSSKVSPVVGTRFYQMDDYLYSAEKIQYMSNYPIFGQVQPMPSSPAPR